MLQRVPLSDEQRQMLERAMENGDEGLHLEMSTNIFAGFRDFLATRVLPLPPMEADFRLMGEERDYAIALFSSEDGYVLLQQMRREGDTAYEGEGSIEANFVLRSDLPFMEEHRSQDWPRRVRRMMLDVVQWKMEQGRELLTQSQHPLWQQLSGRQAKQDPFFGEDTATLARIARGETTAQAAWGKWAEDEVVASNELEACLRTARIVDNLLRMSPRP